MVYIVAALVLVAAVTVLNLVFTLGVIRRLREHTGLISKGLGHDSPAEGVLAVGERVPAFEATTVDGISLTHRSLAEGAMVAFFSPSCQPCQERLPEFLERAAAAPADAFAVVVGDEAETAEMVAKLRPAVRVLTGSAAEPMIKAFDADTFPALYRMADGGVVAASGHSVTVYPVLAAA
jgi:hypothetical protein